MSRTKSAFYAVQVGRVPGIYSSWEECVEQVKKFPDAKYKKFATLQEAEDFVNNVNQGAPSAASRASDSPNVSSTAVSSMNSTRVVGTTISSSKSEGGCDVVYSDGACKGNGQVGSVAGIGVWWGHNDSRNISERCPGDQTNNRAELIAIIRVLETTPISTRPLIIKTDSQYSIKCIQEWLPSWIKNGWRRRGGEILNKALIQYLYAHITHRAALGQKVILEYVKGHAGIEGNEGADQLANVGATMPAEQDRDWDKLKEKLLAEEARKETMSMALVVVKNEGKTNDVSNAMRVTTEVAAEDNLDDLEHIGFLLSYKELKEMERTQIFD